jgi:hypothetical protein
MNFFLKLNYYRKYKLYQKLIKQQNGLCYVSETLIDLEIDFKKLTVEYIKPLDEGGKDELKNYFLAFDSKKFFFTATGPVVCSDKKIYFSHIPKNGGSSIRKLLEPVCIPILTKEERIEFCKLNLDINHLTLPIINKYLPYLFERIVQYDSFAIMRDPYSRFASSLAQRLRWYKKKEIAQLSSTEIKKEIQNVIDYLTNLKVNVKMLDSEYIHFQKQTDYIFNDKNQIIKNVYTIDQVEILSKVLLQKIDVSGTSFINDKVNKTMAFKNEFLRFIFSIGRYFGLTYIFRFLSDSFRENLRNKFLTIHKEGKGYLVFQTPEIKDFIKEYYKEDIIFYNKTNNIN